MDCVYSVCVGVEGKEVGMTRKAGMVCGQVRTCNFMTFVYLAKSA